MNKVLVTTTKQMNMLSDESFFLDYFLTEEEIVSENGIGICSYGVEVVLRSGEVIERKAAPMLSCEKVLVLELIDALFKNVVTPTTLLDIVSDRMYEWEEEVYELGNKFIIG